jgi:replication factor A1
MLKIPLQDIISKIKQSTGLSDSEINKKIDDKLSQLSGLISKEGAAHIIANELGVKIFEQTTGKLQIKNILSGMRSVETVGKVTKKFELRNFQTETRSGKVANMIIADETGQIRLVLWGEIAENLNKLNEGDIVKIIGGYVRENQGRKEVHMNDRSNLMINPEGETVGQIKEYEKAQRKHLNELAEGMENVEVLGTIVQAFEPRFFEVCPECGKRTKFDNTAYTCDVHGAINPAFSYVLNAFLDDGTENVRCVFFKNQAERLLGKTYEEMLSYKENPQKFETIKNELLGNFIKVIGRVNKNQMFDRLEFVSQLVFTNLDPSEEIKNIPEKKTTYKEQTVSSREVEDNLQTEEELIDSEVEKIN